MKQEIIDLIQNRINEIGNQHDVYSKNEVQKELTVLLNKISKIEEEPSEDFLNMSDKIQEFVDNVKHVAKRAVNDFDADDEVDVSLRDREIEVNVCLDNLADEVVDAIQDEAEDAFPQVYGKKKG